MRKYLAAAFYPSTLKSLIPVFNRKARNLTRVVDGYVNGGPFDFMHLIFVGNLNTIAGWFILYTYIQGSGTAENE